MGTLKRALKKASFEKADEEIFQNFLRFYRVTSNLNRPSGMYSAELIFPRYVKSVIDKLLTSRKTRTDSKIDTNRNKIGNKVFFRAYKNRKER